MLYRVLAGFVLCLALALLPLEAQSRPQSRPLSRPLSRAHVRLQSRPPMAHQARPQRTAAVEPAVSAPRPTGLMAEVTLADIGFVNGLHFANLGGHHQLFVPLPEGGDVGASELVLAVDDFSAHDARRSLEVQVNDRTVAALVLDGKGRDRTVRVPLGKIKPRDGYLKLSFIYSGAATLDRCIDVRYVGDSLTIRPETAVLIDAGPVGALDVDTTASLMPREVAIFLPGRTIAANEMATALAVGRALIASGRHVSFYHGYAALPGFAQRDEAGLWARGIVVVGPLTDAASIIDSPVAATAGDLKRFGALDAVRIGGLPALLISDGEVVRAGRLFASPLLGATRGIASASVGTASPIALPTDRVTFDQLAIPLQQVEVFGRAELTTAIDTRRLPAGTRPKRVLLDVMVAPDGTGEKAVVSAFVNDRLLGSTVAATGEATHLDLPLPDGLVGTLANVRVVVQRDSAQGDCRFEPQGYPAQILGSSALVLGKAENSSHDFSDLISQFARRLEILLPASAANHPARVLGILAEVANQLSPDTAPLAVAYVARGAAPAPDSPFIALGDTPPAGASLHVHFDRGRVAVIDRAGHTLLDLGGFAGGAVAQVVSAGGLPGLWIKPLSPQTPAPAPPDLRLDHGDVAFVDRNGVALAMSTERDALVRISYPDQVSWLTIAERFRSWIITGLWLFATAILLVVLQRPFRRRNVNSSD
jgi:hypothetical protein